ncbi:PDZ domain-containing protein [Lysinibacillus sp. MHQ-1]|nr:PDZ domain-containing protein [Lysinibacillus sp. MHQ-1]
MVILQLCHRSKNSPAEKAGLLPKDIILTVDGKSIQGFSATEAVALIRGEKRNICKIISETWRKY